MYYLARVYSGQLDRSPEEFDKLVGAELVPRLKAGGGLVRYTTMLMSDGRIASRSVYETKEAAQQGLEISKEWVTSTGAAQQLKLDTTYEGEIAGSLDGPSIKDPAPVGIARIYETTATADQILAAIREQMQANAAAGGADAGRHRTTVVQLGSNQVGAFTTYASEAAAQTHSQRIQETRSNGTSSIAKLTPNEPTVLNIRILNVHLA